MRVLVAPDSFGGTLGPRAAAEAIATGWRRARPADELVLLPLSDGGEGLREALARPVDVVHEVEVAGPLGLPVSATFLLGPDGRAVVESAAAAGLALVEPHRRDPLLTTTWGVGELIAAAVDAGARTILVGLGGSATVDGGAGALSGLGMRLTVEDGSGLKVGGGELGRVARVERGWLVDLAGVELELLADVTTPLTGAARRFAPQKGADAGAVARLGSALERWAEVASRDLPAAPGPDAPGTGAAGGLAFGLAAGLGAPIVAGAARVAGLVGLEDALAGAELVVTGEGRLDATTAEGKVVDHVLATAAAHGVPVVAVVGVLEQGDDRLVAVEASAPGGPGDDPAGEVAAAAERLAARSPVHSMDGTL
jgi:glycerate kinase